MNEISNMLQYILIMLQYVLRESREIFLPEVKLDPANLQLLTLFSRGLEL